MIEIVLGLVFLMIFTITFSVLHRTKLFDVGPAAILGLCVSGLSTIGLHQMMKDSLHLILLPFVVLAIAMLVVLLLSLFSKRGVKDGLYKTQYTKPVDITALRRPHDSIVRRSQF